MNPMSAMYGSYGSHGGVTTLRKMPEEAIMLIWKSIDCADDL